MVHSSRESIRERVSNKTTFKIIKHSASKVQSVQTTHYNNEVIECNLNTFDERSKQLSAKFKAHRNLCKIFTTKFRSYFDFSSKIHNINFQKKMISPYIIRTGSYFADYELTATSVFSNSFCLTATAVSTSK